MTDHDVIITDDELNEMTAKGKYERALEIMHDTYGEIASCGKCHSHNLIPCNTLTVNGDGVFVKYECVECGTITDEGDSEFMHKYKDLATNIRNLIDGQYEAILQLGNPHCAGDGCGSIIYHNNNLNEIMQLFSDVDMLPEDQFMVDISKFSFGEEGRR